MEDRNPDIAFTRNPLRFTDTHSAESAQRSFIVRIGGDTVYTGHYYAPATIDIAEIVEAFVPKIPDPDDGSGFGEGEVLFLLEGPDEFDSRRVIVSYDKTAPPLRRPFFALPGGVSPQNFRRLSALDTDIFGARLLDRKHNFFLTSRTHGWMIVMDELELYPLIFVRIEDAGEGEDSEIEVKAAGSSFSMPMYDNERGIYALDIAKIRMAIAKQDGFLGSVFDVLCNGYLACRIVIKESPPERNSTLVKFRNSLGAFELIHLSGERLTKAAPEKNDNSGKQYFPDTGRYERISSRRSVGYSIDVATGFKDNDGLMFLLDMAASEEVYLRQASGWTRVIPSIEDISLRDPQMQPASVKVSFFLAEERDNQTPDINDLKDFERPRIFSDEHTDEFN